MSSGLPASWHEPLPRATENRCGPFSCCAEGLGPVEGSRRVHSAHAPDLELIGQIRRVVAEKQIAQLRTGHAYGFRADAVTGAFTRARGRLVS
jgi:hypothetical protein